VAAIDVLEQNLDMAVLLPQVINQVVGVSVSNTDQIHLASNWALMRNLTCEDLVKIQRNEVDFLDMDRIKADVSAIRAATFKPGTLTTLGNQAVTAINDIPDVQNAQRTITHQSVSLICTSFEAYCKDRFYEITGNLAPQNVMNLKAVYTLFAVHTKSLKFIPDDLALDVILRAIPIDVDVLKKCFTLRHVIVHRAGILDEKAILELSLPTSDNGKLLSPFLLSEIQTFAQAIHATGHWINKNT
jgi:hypothetical protein